MTSGESSKRGAHGRKGRATVVWVGVSLVAVALLAGAFGHAAAAPSGASSSSIGFASVPSPTAVAATPTELLALSASSCSTIYAISATGAVSTFATFGSTLSKCSEGALAIAPGLGNFPAGEVYVLQNGVLFQIPAGGSTTPVPAALTIANLSGTYSGLTFDYSGSFGYALLAVGGKTGNAYAIGPTNTAQFLGSFGTYVEGPSVAPMSFGSFGGDLVVASEGKSPVYAMSPVAPHTVQQFSSWPYSQAVSFVPGLACSFATTGYAYFVADYSTNQILTFPSSTFGGDTGSALLLGEYKNAGVGVVGPSGAVTSSVSVSGTLEGASYVACPIGIAQEVDLSGHGFDTAIGSSLNLIGFDPARGELVGADPTNAATKIFLLSGATGTFVQNVSVGLDPTSVAYNPKTNALFVANSGSDNLTVLNATTLAELGQIPTGSGSSPVSVAYNGQNTKLYVANRGNDTVDVFSLANNLFPNQNQIMVLNGTPLALASDPYDGNVYVVGTAAAGGGLVWEIHAFAVVNAVSLPSSATAIAVNPVSGACYVTVPGANEVVLLAAGALPLSSISIPTPLGIAFNTENGLVTIASGNGNAYLVEGNAVLTSFLLGQNPGMLVYDPVSNLVYGAADVTVSNVDPRLVIGSST